MHDAWQNASVTALLAMRGGYGSAQLLPLLDAALLADARKLLIGYSDVTALLCLHLMRGVVAIHGPMGEGRLARGRDGYDEASFRAVVTRAEPAGALAPSGVAALHRGEARGPLVGGTLTQLVSLLGTPWAFEVPRGAILFLEDVGERPYRIHRMLTQLAQAGALARAAGIVFGEFPRCDEPGGSPAIRDVLAEFTSGFPGPVLFGFPSGHTTGPMWTLPLGVRAWLRTAPQPGLIIEEAAVD
jgi:muramoyltetrapeptide carboxypeptidase